MRTRRWWVHPHHSFGSEASGTRPRSGSLCRVALLMACLCLGLPVSPIRGSAQELRNDARGSSGGAALDLSRASVRLQRTLAAAPGSVAEISPNIIFNRTTANMFVLDILPRISVSDPAVSRLRIEAPASFSGLRLTSIQVAGVTLEPGDPLPAPGRYRVETRGTTFELSLGTPITENQTPIRLRFTADGPDLPERASFAVAVESPAGPTYATAGNADADSTDSNSLDVTVRSVIDPARSVVLVDPPAVLADGVSLSRITAFLRDDYGRPVRGKTILFSSSRALLDSLEQPVSPTDSSGMAVGTIRSPHPGISTLTALVVTDSLAIPMQPLVSFTQGVKLALEKSADRQEATVGTLVNYTVTLRNRDESDVVGVHLDDRIPPGFKYLAGSARLDGRTIPNPTGERTLSFPIGALPARTGLASLTYTLVVGSSVSPGSYTNSAVAQDFCEGCAVSNTGQVRVQVVEDALFSLGTVLGQVYEDRDQNGKRDTGEAGIAEARVVLDDGSVAITDAEGLYHFAAVRPGQRLLKIDLNSLPGRARATTPLARVEGITPGLLATGNFGVAFDTDTLFIGRPAEPGIRMIVENRPLPLDLRGSIDRLTGVVNGSVISLPSGDIRLETSGREDVVELGGDSTLPPPLAFRARLTSSEPVRDWLFRLFDAKGLPVWTHAGTGHPPETILWNGVTEAGHAIAPTDIYQYQLEVQFAGGAGVKSPRRLFGVNRRQSGTVAGAPANGASAPGMRARLLDSYRAEPGVTVDGQPMPVGSDGRFAAALPDSGHDRVAIELMGRQGESIRADVALPRLVIANPVGEVRLPFGADFGGNQVIFPGGAEPAQSIQLAGHTVGAERSLVARVSLQGFTDPGATVLVNGHPAKVGDDGSFASVLDLALGSNIFAVVARNAAGGSRLSNVSIDVADRQPTGAPIFAIDPIPPLRVFLPPAGERLTNTRLVVRGSTAPGNRVLVNGDSVTVAPDGSFRTVARLNEGRNNLMVKVVDRDGYTGLIEREYPVDSHRLFFLALADGVVSQLSQGGQLDSANAGAEPGLFSDSRVAFFVKGWVAGKYLVTSAFDSRSRTSASLFSGIDPAGATRLLTRLDPDRLYPVYGDSSRVEYSAPTRGRFYLGIEGDDLSATVGDYAMSFDGTDLAAYRRTLYGTHVRYHSLSKTRYGAPTTEVAVIGAEVRQVHVRDELRATGGSLYYLSRRRVVEGSEQVSLAVRDPNTGLTLARMPQRPFVDYTLKNEEGRILFERPIESVLASSALVSTATLAGNPVTIEIDYESVTEILDNSLIGGRLRQSLGPHLGVGGTYVRDELSAGRYEMSGVDAEVRLGPNSSLSGEMANSTGGSSHIFQSDDGGLTYREAVPSGAKSGSAWRGALDLDLGQMLKMSNRLRLQGYARKLDPGFFSSANAGDLGTEKQGASVGFQNRLLGGLTLRHDRETRLGTDWLQNRRPGSSRISSALWKRDLGRWGLGAEYQARTAGDSDSAGLSTTAYVAGRIWSKLGRNFTGELLHQESVQGHPDGRTSLGLHYKLASRLGFDLAATDGRLGRSLTGGAAYSIGTGSLYLRGQLSRLGLDEQTRTVVGGQVPVGTSGRLYSEYQREQGSTSLTSLSVLGAEKLWRVGRGVQLQLTGEHGENAGVSATTRRSAVSTGVSYSNGTSLTARTRLEVRFQDGGPGQVQWLSTQQAEARLLRGLTLAGLYRYGSTRDRTTDRLRAGFEEGSVGLAYRPPDSGRFNLLARVTRLSDTRAATIDSNNPTTSSMDVASIEGSFYLTPWLEWVGKQAVRFLAEGEAGSESPRTRSALTIGRFNWVGPHQLRLGLEYRTLGQREAQDRRQGSLTEVTWDPLANLRLGAGYNFTHFSDNEFSRNDHSVRGWFLRMQGRY